MQFHMWPSVVCFYGFKNVDRHAGKIWQKTPKQTCPWEKTFPFFDHTFLLQEADMFKAWEDI